MKTITMDEITYLVNDEVADLIIILSEERDELEDALMEKLRPVAISPLQRGVMPHNSKDRKCIESLNRRVDFLANRIANSTYGNQDHDKREMWALGWALKKIGA